MNPADNRTIRSSGVEGARGVAELAADDGGDHFEAGDVAIEFAFGDMTFDETRQSAGLFAAEVMPAFRH